MFVNPVEKFVTARIRQSSRVVPAGSDQRFGSRGKQSGPFGHLYHVSVEETVITGPYVARAAFEQAFRLEAARLYYLALTIVRSPADAEDVVQETALSAWRAWSRLRDPA